MKTDQLCDSDNSTAVPNKNGQSNHYMPFSELIDQFHKIKAGHVKVRHSIVCDRLLE